MTSETSQSDRTPAVRVRAATWLGQAGSRELLHRILLTTDGTVTTILEAYAGEPIGAIRLAQSLQPARPQDAEPLAVAAGSSVLARHVLLRGARSGTTFLSGESLIVSDRLGPSIVDRLGSTNEPIGQLLRTYRLETFREVLAVGEQPAGSFGTYFGSGQDALLLFRTYRIILRGQPIALITEKVLAEGEEVYGT